MEESKTEMHLVIILLIFPLHMTSKETSIRNHMTKIRIYLQTKKNSTMNYLNVLIVPLKTENCYTNYDLS